MSAKQTNPPTTTGQLRSLLGRLLAGLEDGSIDPSTAQAACKVASTINQSMAEETKAFLAQKELGAVQIQFGNTLIGEGGPTLKALGVDG